MSTYRQIHTKIWKDPWFLELPPEHKLLFIYLFSNEQANLMGLYQIPLKVIAFETDLEVSTVEEALAHFAVDGKVLYEDNYIWIINMFQYNANNPGSPKTQEHILNTLRDIPDIPLKTRLVQHYTGIIPDGYPLYTPCIPVPQEQEQKQEQIRTGTDQEQQQQHSMDSAVAAVQVMEKHGMTNAEAVLRETTLTPAQLIDTVHYAEAQGLGAGWVRAEARENRAHSPPSPAADRRRFAQGEYVQS